jgi:hypothetical protein
MCQKSACSAKLTVVKEDVIVWKVVFVGKSSTITSFCQSFKYRLGKTYQIQLDKIKYGRWLHPFYTLYHDGFHSFKYSFHAERDAKSYDGTIVKCIIPKGSRVVMGISESDGGVVPTFVSNKIRLVEIV